MRLDDLLDEFKNFCRTDLLLSERTVRDHIRRIRKFADAAGKDVCDATQDDVRRFLASHRDEQLSYYANWVKSLRRFYRDFLGMSWLVSSFRLPQGDYHPKKIPSDESMKRFYDALQTTTQRGIFLFLATTGLRRNEALTLGRDNIDPTTRMVIPSNRDSSTKRTWVSFYNEECSEVLDEILESNNDGRVFHQRKKPPQSTRSGLSEDKCTHNAAAT